MGFFTPLKTKPGVREISSSDIQLAQKKGVPMDEYVRKLQQEGWNVVYAGRAYFAFSDGPTRLSIHDAFPTYRPRDEDSETNQWITKEVQNPGAKQGPIVEVTHHSLFSDSTTSVMSKRPSGKATIEEHRLGRLTRRSPATAEDRGRRK